MEQQSGQSTQKVCPRGAGYYMWQTGDTLAGVARRNATTTQAVRLINEGVDFQRIEAGTEICMPSRAQTCLSGTPYTVRQGDTFAGIAQRVGISETELSERNPDVNFNALTVGDVICVPRAEADKPVEDGAGADQNTVPPQPVIPQPVQPGLSCPVGFSARRVQAGESYADLLIDLNVSYKALRTANPTLRPGRLTAGTAFCAPPAGSREACGARRYTVAEGDALALIARRLSTTPGRLLMLNPTLLPTDFSQPGTMICIP